MKKFYIFIDKKQQGPFDFEELKTKKIEKTTKIWFEGMEDWKIASEIKELKPLFNIITPPPIKPTLKQQPKVGKNFFETNKIAIISVILVTIFGLGFFLYNKSKNEKLIEEKRIETYNNQLKQQQEELRIQNEKIAEQERIENERAKKEKIDNILAEMNNAYEKKQAAEKKLVDVTSFKLLRSSSTRSRQINEVQNLIKFWEEEIERLEKEMKKVNPKWGSEPF